MKSFLVSTNIRSVPRLPGRATTTLSVFRKVKTFGTPRMTHKKHSVSDRGELSTCGVPVGTAFYFRAISWWIQGELRDDVFIDRLSLVPERRSSGVALI